MGSWFVLSALGIYQLEPGGSSYVIGSPLFANVTITVPGGRRALRIEAVGNGKGRPYVASVTLNGRPLDVLEAPYKSLMQGGVLRFVMSDATTMHGSRPEAPQ